MQPIKKEQWGDSGDYFLDDVQNRNLDDLWRFKMDKAGAGNGHDDADNETLAKMHKAWSSSKQQYTPHPIHLLSASTVGPVPIYSASQHLFTPVSGLNITLDDDTYPYDYFCQFWGFDTFKYSTTILQL